MKGETTSKEFLEYVAALRRNLWVTRINCFAYQNGHCKTEYCVVLRGREYLISNCFVTYESFDNDPFSCIDHENFNGVSLYVTSQHVKIQGNNAIAKRTNDCHPCIENCCVLQHIEVGWKWGSCDGRYPRPKFLRLPSCLTKMFNKDLSRLYRASDLSVISV